MKYFIQQAVSGYGIKYSHGLMTLEEANRFIQEAEVKLAEWQQNLKDFPFNTQVPAPYVQDLEGADFYAFDGNRLVYEYLDGEWISATD